jgi:hypothetical protein
MTTAMASEFSLVHRNFRDCPSPPVTYLSGVSTGTPLKTHPTGRQLPAGTAGKLADKMGCARGRAQHAGSSHAR